MYKIDWSKYLSRERFSHSPEKDKAVDKRTPFESDFGRVIFSAPMRRMHDKTQVFPLTSGDTVHTRLTHSMEVMNTAHSLVINLCRDDDFIKEYGGLNARILEADLGMIAKTAAFVHDIGNPPFGHFGETVIQNFFKKYFKDEKIVDEEILDFTEFDGNAQGFRILTHLSYIGRLSGFNLTYATLGAYLKYPNKGKIDKKYIGTKKHGIYRTEKEVFDKVVEACGLKTIDGRVKRHPVSFLVEAADSISYLVMDIEDGYSVHWYDRHQMGSYLDRTITALNKDRLGEIPDEYKYNKDGKEIIDFMKLISKGTWDYKKDANSAEWIMKFRTNAIQYLVDKASTNFKNNLETIDKGSYSKELIDDDPNHVSETLQKFTQRYIFPQKEIQKAELTGKAVVGGLLDILLQYVRSEDKQFRKRVKAVISKSALRVAIHENNPEEDYMYHDPEDFFNFDLKNLTDYGKIRLVVDFVSGMTDKFAVLLYQQLSGHKIN